MENSKNFSKLLVHPNFNKTISAVNKLDLTLQQVKQTELDFNPYPFPPNGKLVNLEEFKSYTLDPKKGESTLKDGLTIYAYDESINKFSSLEGSAFLTSHSLILLDTDYLPTCYVTFYFYTKSKEFVKKSHFIKYSEEPEVTSKEDYVLDRSDFIVSNVSDNSIILIDGPLIGGNVASYTVNLNDKLLEKNVFPIFFVKNSSSNLVTDNMPQTKGKYNSDLHWSFKTLNQGERTCFFRYRDEHSKNEKSKVFCYIKAFDVCPQRIEFHTRTFEKFKNRIGDIMNVMYYLMLVQGSPRNPQVRPIAIAEKFARETIHLFPLKNIMKETGITSTMNQERFGWS